VRLEGQPVRLEGRPVRLEGRPVRLNQLIRRLLWNLLQIDVIVSSIRAVIVKLVVVEQVYPRVGPRAGVNFLAAVVVTCVVADLVNGRVGPSAGLQYGREKKPQPQK